MYLACLRSLLFLLFFRRGILLQKYTTNQKADKSTDCRLPNPSWHINNWLLHPDYEVVSSVSDREVTPMKSQWSPNKTYRMTILVAKPMWVRGGLSQVPNPLCSALGNKWLLKEKESVFYSDYGGKLLDRLSILGGQDKHIHRSKTKGTQLATHTHTHIYM